MAKVITSEAYKLIKQDFIKWFNNQKVFIIPALIVFLVAIQQGASLKEASLAVYTWALGAVLDILRKYVQENKYANTTN